MHFRFGYLLCGVRYKSGFVEQNPVKGFQDFEIHNKFMSPFNKGENLKKQFISGSEKPGLGCREDWRN